MDTSATPKVEKRPMRHRWQSRGEDGVLCIRRGCSAKKVHWLRDRTCRTKAIVRRTPPKGSAA